MSNRDLIPATRLVMGWRLIASLNQPWLLQLSFVSSFSYFGTIFETGIHEESVLWTSRAVEQSGELRVG